MDIEINEVQEIIKNLEGSGELSIKEEKYLKVAKLCVQLAAERDAALNAERAQQIFLGNGPEPSASEERELARMALAAMDSEPHTDGELSNLLWYSQVATCHSDPNYYCEFQRLATPGVIAGIIRELQERRKAAMDSEPVFTLEVASADYKGQKLGNHFGFITLDAARELKEGNYQLYTAQPAPEKYNIGEATMCHIFTATGMTDVSDMQAVFDRIEAVLAELLDKLRIAERDRDKNGWYVHEYSRLEREIESATQPAPVVPEEMTPEMMRSVQLNSELGAYAASNLSGAYDLFAEFWKEACRAVMLAAAQQSPGSDPATVPGKWIPVSEQMPEVGDIVLTAMGVGVTIGETECTATNCRFFTSVISGRELPATHWMPLPAAPQEDEK